MKIVVVAIVVGVLVAPGLFALEPAAKPAGMVERALSWIGVRYRFGGQDEKKGFDCAGLVRRVFSIAVDLPSSAAAQFRHGREVPPEELQPGDLVFFKNTYKRGISHVGIYVGDGEFVHAASRRSAVRIDRLDSSYFRQHFAGARRIAAAEREGWTRAGASISRLGAICETRARQGLAAY